MSDLSPYMIEFKDFGSDQLVPMAFPEGTTLDEVRLAAANLVDQGKVQHAKVYRRGSLDVIAEAGWKRI